MYGSSSSDSPLTMQQIMALLQPMMQSNAAAQNPQGQPAPGNPQAVAMGGSAAQLQRAQGAGGPTMQPASGGASTALGALRNGPNGQLSPQQQLLIQQLLQRQQGAGAPMAMG